MLGWDDLVGPDAKVRLWVLKSLSRRRCMLINGRITRSGLREAIRFHADRIPLLIDRKRRDMGLPPVKPDVVVFMAHQNDGFSREA